MNILGIGVVLFHLTPAEVWKLTPAEFAAFCKVVNQERYHIDFQFGWVRHLLFEPNRDKQQRPTPTTIEDFLAYGPQLSKGEDGTPALSREMTPDEQLAYVTGCVIPYFKAREEAEKARERREG